MAKSNKEQTNGSANNQAKPSTNSRFPNRITFYDGYIDSEDRKWIDSNFDAAATTIFELVGYSAEYGGLSCKYEQRSGKYLAILFGGDTPETGQGYALTARASTPALALFVLAYKAMHKFSGAWYGGNSTDTMDYS